MKAKKGIIWTVSILVVLGIAAAIIIPRAMAAANKEPPQAIPVNVTTGTPETGEISLQTELIGTIQPGEIVYTLPKTSGEVLETYFEEGDTVNAGDVLLRISDDAVRPQIDQAQAAVDLAKLNVDMVGGGSTQQQLNQLESSLETARLTLEDAEKSLERTKELFEVGAVSQQNLEQAQKGYDMAKLQYDSTQKTLELTKGQILGDSLNAAQAQLRQAQVGLDSAKKQLDYTRVTAPISGVIEKKNVKVHDMASPQSAAYVISSKDQMTVNFYVSEGNRKAMSVGDPIEIQKDGKTYSGSILEVGNMVDQTTGLFLIKGSIDTTDPLYTGSTVKISATTQRVENTVLIPLDAVYYEAGKPYVFLYENGQSKKVSIETGLFSDTAVQVKNGLAANSSIITSWSSQLRDGAKVSVVEEGGGTAPAESEGTAT